jgi:hypothetical protein
MPKKTVYTHQELVGLSARRSFFYDNVTDKRREYWSNGQLLATIAAGLFVKDNIFPALTKMPFGIYEQHIDPTTAAEVV